jgi:hypothetical protein
MAAANTIVLAGQPIYPQEALAGEAITPGHLVTFGSGGTANKLIKHATAAGNAAAMFAVENTTPDRSVTTAPIDTPYASGETVKWVMARPGSEIYAWVPASATAVIKGSFLTSNGDGTLRLSVPQASNEGGTATYTIQTRAIVAIAAEAVDNSAGGSAARLRVYVV